MNEAITDTRLRMHRETQQKKKNRRLSNGTMTLQKGKEKQR